MFDDGPGDGKSIKRSGTAAHFIEQHQTCGRSVIQDRRDFAHFDQERRPPPRQIVARPDARWTQNAQEESPRGVKGPPRADGFATGVSASICKTAAAVRRRRAALAATEERTSIKSCRSISRTRSSAARIFRSYSFSSEEVKRSALTRVCLRSESAGARVRGSFEILMS